MYTPPMGKLGLKRVYEAPAASDGARFLVERLWPRGITKESARLEAWLKDVSPSPALRTWYAHDVTKWDEFRRRYLAELAAAPDGLETIRGALRRGPTTLVFAAKDPEHSSAAVLRDLLEGRA